MKTSDGDDDLENFFLPRICMSFLVISMMIMTFDATATVKMVMIIISTEGALRRPMTYDNHTIHPCQSHPHMGQFVQGGKKGCLMSFLFFKVEPSETKLDELAPLFQLSVVYHMLWMTKTLWLDLWGHFRVP